VFLASPLLWGLLAAGIPVLIHLLGRTKPVPHRFPAMRFLLRSQKSSARTLKLKHILLLLLRIAAIALIAVALARPLGTLTYTSAVWAGAALVAAVLVGWSFRRGEFSTAVVGSLVLLGVVTSFPKNPEQEARVRGDFVLIMDQSMSMSYVEPGGSRFDRARKAALSLLDRLAPDSRLALIFATENAERAQSRLSYRHEVVREKLLAARPTGRGLDIDTAIQAALEILARENSVRNPTILFFTDLQGIGKGRPDSLNHGTGRLDSLPHVPALVVVDVGSDQAQNSAALGLTLPASVLPADSKVAVHGKIKPLDKTLPTLVELYVDEKKVAQALVESKGQDSVDVELQLPTGPAGPHSGRLQLPTHDRMEMDQSFAFAYQSGRPPSILLLERPESGEQKGSGFFLNAVLTRNGDESIGVSGLNCVVEPVQELTAAVLSRYRVVILADCGRLSDSSWSALKQWTADGGGLFVWLGPAMHTSTARQGFQQHASFGGLLPGNVGLLTQRKPPQNIAVSQAEHPILAHCGGAVSAVLRETLVSSLVRIVPDPHDTNSSVILSLADDAPVLMEKLYGRGRVLLAAIDPGMQCSDLPRRGEAFVSLVLDSVRLLSGEDSGTQARLGFPFTLNLPVAPQDGQVFWRKPGESTPAVLRVDVGQAVSLPTSSRQTASATVIVPPIETPGIHTFSWTPAGATLPLTRMLAVNPETSESFLTRAAPELFRKALAPLDAQIVRDLADYTLPGEEKGAARREVTAALLLLLLVALLVESFLSNRLYAAVESPDDDAQGQEASEKAASELPAQTGAGEKRTRWAEHV
jgi:multidrug transporter EmrE-like cation transporter